MKTDWILEKYSGNCNLLKNYQISLCITPVFLVIKLVANCVSMGFILSCSSRHETGYLKKSVLNNEAVYQSVCAVLS